MNADRLLSLMQETIAEAERSKPEDARPHPKVGAIISDRDGNILFRAHRGEFGNGGHAEFSIFQKARSAGIELNDKVLFVTLEPCTKRSTEKLPCAVRVALSGIREVHIGSLDPNPDIIGRGEHYLISRGITVERFPFSLGEKLRKMNEAAFAHQSQLVMPVIGFDPLIEEIKSGAVVGDLGLHGNREALLQSTLDLIVSSSGDICMFSGALSWLKEMQIGLIVAAISGRSIRILCQKGDHTDAEFAQLIEIATSSGASVASATSDTHLRGTLAISKDSKDTLILVERDPALHAVLLNKPYDSNLIAFIHSNFEVGWSTSREWPARSPLIAPIALETIEAALKSGVRFYEKCTFELAEIDLREVQFLSANVERFKLFRVGVLEHLKSQVKMPELAQIVGSPWPLLPPIVEMNAKGEQTLIDGMHRAYYWLERGQPIQKAILIKNVKTSLPAVPVKNMDAVVVTSEKWPRTKRYQYYNEEYFRPISSSLARALRSRQ